MLKRIDRHYRAFVLILCTGILFVTLLNGRPSYAKEISFEKLSSQETVLSKDPVSGDVAQEIGADTQGEEAGLAGEQIDDVTDLSGAIDLAAISPASGEEGFGAEDLVLAVFVDRQRLSPGIFAVQKNGQYYLPFATLSQIVGFYYDMDASTRFVEGWALSEDDDYSIDAQNHLLRFRGEKFDLPPEAVLASDVADDDVYVLIDVLSQIWPLQLDVNLSSLVLKITPDSKLPFQMAFERKIERERYLLGKEQEAKEDNFPLVPYPYRLYSKPTIDLSAVLGYDETANESVAILSANGVNDLAYASADYSVTVGQKGGEFQRPENIRFRLRRQNIHEGALPFGLEDAQLGDVRLRNRELIASGAGGRGFVFSTEKNKKVGEFDLVTIDGTGSPAWEVELYLNNELIDFGLVDDRGEYRFEDISVGFGNNRFRIVLYGPQGQIKERIENYVYQSSMIQKGDYVFSGGIVDADSDLIPVEERNTGRVRGLTANFYAARGISEKLTGFVTANTIREKGTGGLVSREYLSAGTIGSVGSTLAQVEAYKQLDGGSAIDVRTLSDFMGFKVNTQISKFSRFESPDAQSGSYAKELETEIGVKRIFRTLMGSLGLELRHNYLKRRSGAETSRFMTRQSFGFKGVRMTNTTATDLVASNHQSTTGRFSTSSRLSGWRLRNSLNYNVHPKVEFTSLQSELRYGRQRDYMTALRASYNLDDKEARLGFQISKDFEKFLGSVETEWSSDDGIGFSLRASTSLGPYGDNGRYLYRSSPLTGVGPVDSFIYTDKNYNSVYDEGDLLVRDAKVVINRRITREKTDETGHLTEFISAASGKTNMKVAQESIRDPYLVPSVEGYNVHPRAGVVHKLEFPLIETGAIDGALKWDYEGEPIPGVTLQLLNAEADVIQTARTAVDGYFTFERIPPGDYTIRPDPAEGLDIPFKYVTLTPDNLFHFGEDILSDPESAPLEVDLNLDIEVDKEGTLNLKDIPAIMKGYKEKKTKPETGKNPQSLTPAGSEERELPNETAVSTPESLVEEDLNISTHSNKKAKPLIESIRIGDHSSKVRIVMDLSAPLEYSIDFDPQSNAVFVEMPYADWLSSQTWSKDCPGILNSYRMEKMEQGVRLILDIEDDADIGASGLLKANGDKKDRLYIDIEKQ